MKNYLDIFAESYRRVREREVDSMDFFESFYATFFASSDEVVEKFRGVDMEQQRRHLRESLTRIIYFSVDRKAGDKLEKIATKHSKADKAIRAPLYDLWLASLLQAVRRFDPEFDNEVEIAWRVILAPGIAYMQARYESP